MRSYGLKHEESYELRLQISHVVGSLVGVGKGSSHQIALRAHGAWGEYGERGEYAELSVAVGSAGMLAGGL